MRAGSDVKVKRESSRGSTHEFETHGLAPRMLCYKLPQSIPFGKEVYHLCKYIRKFPFQFFSKTAVILSNPGCEYSMTHD